MCLQEMSKDYLSPADPVGEDLGLILERLHWASASHAPPPCVKGRVCSPSPAPSQDGQRPPPPTPGTVTMMTVRPVTRREPALCQASPDSILTVIS